MKDNQQPYGPINEADLAQFERRLPASPPADLRQFLVESNGATFSDAAELNDVQGGAALEAIFGLHGGPEDLRLDHMRAQFEGLVPGSIVVFAGDCYGNYFGVSLHDDDAGTVYFVDHENLPATRDSLVRVAGSFTELLTRSRV